MKINSFIDKFTKWSDLQLTTLAKTNPIVGIAKPFVTRIIKNHTDKISDMLKIVADSNGNIDADNIVKEIIENVINADRFTINTKFIGDIEIGEGKIKLNIPFTTKSIVLNTEDLKSFENFVKESYYGGSDITQEDTP